MCRQCRETLEYSNIYFSMSADLWTTDFTENTTHISKTNAAGHVEAGRVGWLVQAVATNSHVQIKTASNGELDMLAVNPASQLLGCLLGQHAVIRDLNCPLAKHARAHAHTHNFQI